MESGSESGSTFDINSVIDADGNTSLHIVIDKLLEEYDKDDRYKNNNKIGGQIMYSNHENNPLPSWFLNLVKYYIYDGADIHKRNKKGYSPFLIASDIKKNRHMANEMDAILYDFKQQTATPPAVEQWRPIATAVSPEEHQDIPIATAEHQDIPVGRRIGGKKTKRRRNRNAKRRRQTRK